LPSSPPQVIRKVTPAVTPEVTPEVAWIEPALLAEWAQAYDGMLGERFRLEAQASLPPVGDDAGVEEVYAGVRVQRLRLRFDLGVGEWG